MAFLHPGAIVNLLDAAKFSGSVLECLIALLFFGDTIVRLGFYVLDFLCVGAMISMLLLTLSVWIVLLTISSLTQPIILILTLMTTTVTFLQQQAHRISALLLLALVNQLGAHPLITKRIRHHCE